MHTVGGVITPGEVVMLVPVTDELTVEAHVAPQDRPTEAGPGSRGSNSRL